MAGNGRLRSSTAASPSRRGLLALGLGSLAATALPGLAAAAEAAGTPAAFLASIYDNYRAGGSGVPLDDPKVYGRYFTPALAALMTSDRLKADAAGEVPALDADPFTDSQDGEITGIKVKVTSASAEKAAGVVRFRNEGRPVTITLKLASTPAGWRIDDIVWAEGTLRGLYAN